ncbi:D-amino acid aminotransferase [Solemya pervernicosa gill symbiont]|uniref:Aminodeoxychorismate lyase n=2 Tax=Gammaproteobacteria incertae sedis TaxID=118884 RepID=A0A1T2L487_9GAMM|nr:D-amino acid aminotransferase [Candidatus Reidiella endopervernicosa]OOZ39925.1 D-amino acid aminotransferase [Solemya pervernicosa gill symbiont]QKQ25978.1 D-amino acid aminotransferase [Candidatus Reidiella endopervernicosa]
MSDDTIYLNGEFLPAATATISVMDRGFLFGDGVYEVIPAYSGRLFRLEEHLTRLDQSLAGIRMQNPLSHSEWSELLQALLEKNSGGDQSVYLQVTRGAAEKRDHAFPEGIKPTLFASCTPITQPDESYYADGLNAVTLDDIRWQHCNIKAITLLPNVLLRQQAIDAGGSEAILLRDGNAIEGAASNLFIVEGDTIITPPTGPQLLPGITRDLVLELARANDVPCREEAIDEAQLRHADEVWLTSSTKEIMPVTQLDETPVGNGRPGPVWRRLRELYSAYKVLIKEGKAG